MYFSLEYVFLAISAISIFGIIQLMNKDINVSKGLEKLTESKDLNSNEITALKKIIPYVIVMAIAFAIAACLNSL